MVMEVTMSSDLGEESTHYLNPAACQKVLTPTRLMVLREIAAHDHDSIQSLATALEMRHTRTARNCYRLAEHGLVELKPGEETRKQPRLAHENVLVQPIVHNGEVVVDG